MRRLFLLLLMPVSLLFAQLDCDVTLNLTQVPQFRDQLQSFEQDLENYINSQRWASDDFDGDKIKCTMNIFFTSGTNDNNYKAQVFIGSQRPIYVGPNPSSKSSPMVRIFDDKWEFTYIKGQPLYRNEQQFDALTDFIDFYMNLIVGLDYDSYDIQGGAPYFQKCYTFINQAPSSAKGWEHSASSSYTKFQLIDDILNPKYQPFREGWYTYHFKGIDLLATKPVKAKENIIGVLKAIGELKKASNPRAQIFKTFFDTKYQELAEIFKGSDDPNIYQLLISLDQGHQTTYDEALKNR
ncbi:MAG: DUF4835 family protein [Bacteroidetes bacterium]|nr:DUF4835 family protein [Bacteroidota bacterium]